eukprot:5535529-Pleurochrysis_carterae.AAC.1
MDSYPLVRASKPLTRKNIFTRFPPFNTQGSLGRAGHQKQPYLLVWKRTMPFPLVALITACLNGGRSERARSFWYGALNFRAPRRA